jgi:hypothetical protein
LILPLCSNRASAIVNRFLHRQKVPCKKRGIIVLPIDRAARSSLAGVAESRARADGEHR